MITMLPIAELQVILSMFIEKYETEKKLNSIDIFLKLLYYQQEKNMHMFIFMKICINIKINLRINK